MNIRVWSSFTKRQNSTLQPGTTGSTQISCVLKEETSIRNPSFILADPMPSITYVQAFGNYYFVTDIINMDANRSEVACSLDVLATYKSSILNYTAFVERSASNYDVYLRDPALSIQQHIVTDDSTTTDISSFMNKTGMFVSTVFTKDKGLVLYLTNTLDVFKGILDSGCYNASDIADWISSKIAAAFDLDVYIGSVKWMPLDLSSHGLSTTLTIGPVGVKAAYIPASAVIKAASPSYRVGSYQAISLPSAIYNDFRDSDPRFTQYSITLPGIGTVQLDSAFVGSCIHNSKTIYDYMMIDISTGQITHSIQTSTNSQSVKFCELKGTIAVDVPIGKSRGNVLETIAAFVGGTSSAASNLAGGGGNPGSVISGVGQSILTGVNVIEAAYCPQTSIIGGSGNHTDLYVNCDKIWINRKVFGPKQFPTAVAGRPLMQNVQLSSLSGFCQCGNASVPVNARDADRAEINAYLNSGFYIE